MQKWQMLLSLPLSESRLAAATLPDPEPVLRPLAHKHVLWFRLKG